jgi:hypothetical protein
MSGKNKQKGAIQKKAVYFEKFEKFNFNDFGR